MASNAEMLRLVQHAADKLAAIEYAKPIRDVIWNQHYHGDQGPRDALVLQLRNVTAAMVLAETTLRFVAACLMDDPPPDPLGPLLDRLTDGHSYTEWADAGTHGMVMTDTELQAVARYLREVNP